MTNELRNRAINAAGQYITRRGYDVIAKSWEPAAEDGIAAIDLVAKDGETLVFVEVTAIGDHREGFEEKHLSRSVAEIGAAQYLAEHPEESDCPVRFDHIDLVVIGDDRALLRHYINALSVAG